jgi:hypothetical protein
MESIQAGQESGAGQDTRLDPDAPTDYRITLEGWLAIHPEYRRVIMAMTR